jgi:hypothetical protein
VKPSSRSFRIRENTICCGRLSSTRFLQLKQLDQLERARDDARKAWLESSKKVQKATTDGEWKNATREALKTHQYRCQTEHDYIVLYEWSCNVMDCRACEIAFAAQGPLAYCPEHQPPMRCLSL